MQVNTTRDWDALITAIDRPDLAVDPRFATTESRDQHGDELFNEIAAWTSQRMKFEVMEYLGARGVPCSGVYDIFDLLSDQHLRERGMIGTLSHPTRGEREFLMPPIRLGNSAVPVNRAPLLGEHTAELLASELGLDQKMLTQLRRSGVIGTLDDDICER